MSATSMDVVAKLTIWLVMIVGLVLAFVMGMAVSESNYYTVLLVATVGGLVFWTVVARDRWWLPFPVAVALGGFVYVGFKLYIHELMLAFCLLPLVMMIAARKEDVRIQREKLPPSFVLFAAFLFFHWIVCLVFNQVNGFGGAGSVTRQYMNAGWPVILFFAYYLFGTSRHLKAALFLMYLVYFLRVAVGLYFYFTTDADSFFSTEQRTVFYIPLINYVPQVGNMEDLRSSTIGLASVSLAYASYDKMVLRRWFHYAVTALCIVANTFGGGRSTFVVCLLLLFFWAVIQRRYLMLLLSGASVFFLVAVLNVYPYSLESVPEKMQRALSGLIFTTDALQIQQQIKASDEFHAMLRQAGYERWTEDAPSILVGHGIRPFDEAAWGDKLTDDVSRQAEQAKLTGRFEKGLWTVLATFGAVGFVLYANILRFLSADAVRHLWRNQIQDTASAFYFLAAFSIFAWFATMLIAGSFPSSEIMLGLFAKVAYEDAKARKKKEESVAQSGAIAGVG